MVKKSLSFSFLLGLGLVAFSNAAEVAVSVTDGKQLEASVPAQPATDAKVVKTCPVCKSCGTAYTYAKDTVVKGAVAVSAFIMKNKINKAATGLAVAALGVVVLYNTNEAFRDFILGSDDEEVN
jgi:hypothetical protein